MSPPTVKETKIKLMQLLPMTWTQLMKETGLSKATLYQHLQELRNKGFIAKTEDGRYVVTEEGKYFLVKIRAIQDLKRLFELDRNYARRIACMLREAVKFVEEVKE